MRVFSLVTVFLFLVSSAVYGQVQVIGDDGQQQQQGQGQDQGQTQGQGQGQDQGQQQGQVGINEQEQGQAQAAVAAGGDSDQAQVQEAIAVQGQAQGNVQASSSSNSIVFEEGDTDVVTAVWPTTPSTQGKQERSIYTLFGGIGDNKTEEHLRIEHQLKVLDTMYQHEIIDKDRYVNEVLDLYEQLDKSNHPGLWLGLLPVFNRGCNVVNACGLLVVK